MWTANLLLFKQSLFKIEAEKRCISLLSGREKKNIRLFSFFVPKRIEKNETRNLKKSIVLFFLNYLKIATIPKDLSSDSNVKNYHWDSNPP